MPNINKIKLSGTSYDIQDSNATKTVTLTQAEYNALVNKDPNTFYIISDGETFDPSEKVDTSAFTAYSASVETALSGKQNTLSAGTGIDITNNVISATGGGGGGISGVTAEYDDTGTDGEFLINVNSGQSFSQIFKVGSGLTVTEDGDDVILSSTGGGGITSGEVQSMIDESISGKQDTLSAGTGIDITNNVISATGGGGKAVVAGTNISVTTGTTADTINCTLPITATSSVFNTISVGQGSGGGSYNTLIGANARCDNNYGHNVFLVAQNSSNSGTGAYVNGTHNVIIGSMKDGYIHFGIQSFNTSRSVVIGGGAMSTDKDNSLAIGYNANVSGTTKTNINNQLTIDTSNQVYIYNKDNTEMICLQDQLGGGSSYTAGDGIDITNDVISVTGKVDTSAITTSVTSSSTDSQVPSAKAVNDKLGGLSIVKLTQAQYDALSTKDSNTLYVITNS